MMARAVNDFDYLESMCTADVVFRVVGDRAFSPFVGTYIGREAARKVLENISVEFVYHDLTMTHIMVDGDQVGLRWTGNMRNRGTGASAEFEGFIHLVFEGDLVREYAAFVDTARMASLMDWGE